MINFIKIILSAWGKFITTAFPFIATALSMQSNRQHGAYLLQDPTNDTLLLFVYKNSTKAVLIEALYEDFKDVLYDRDKKTYLSAVFRNGQDFLGQLSWDEVCALPAIFPHAVELLSNTFEACRAILPNLRKEQYLHFRKFAKKQLV